MQHQLNGPELGNDHVLYSDVYTVILRASSLFGSAQYWAGVVTDGDQMNIHQMSGLNLDGGKFFFIKKMRKDGDGIRWADVSKKFEKDVLDDYARGVAKSAGTEDILPEVGQMVRGRTMTCMEWVVFLISQGQLSPEVLL